MIAFTRFKPTKSQSHSCILTAREIPSEYSDEEIISTLPMIINPQPIRIRKPEICLPSYTTVIEDRPVVYQRIHNSPMGMYRSFERVMQVSPPPTVTTPKTNVHLPKHTKKLVNRFLHNLERAHEHVDGDESDCGIDGCEICRRLRSAMNDGNRRYISDGDLYRSTQVLFPKQKSKRDVHVVEAYPSKTQSQDYPSGYTTFVDPNTGLTYIYDPNWQYDMTSKNPIPNPSTMDKATYTRMPSDEKKDKTVIVHTSRNPTPRTPKIVIEQPRRRHHRRSKKPRSTTIITERTTHIPRTKTRTYL